MVWWNWWVWGWTCGEVGESANGVGWDSAASMPMCSSLSSSGRTAGEVGDDGAIGRDGGDGRVVPRLAALRFETQRSR